MAMKRLWLWCMLMAGCAFQPSGTAESDITLGNLTFDPADGQADVESGPDTVECRVEVTTPTVAARDVTCVFNSPDPSVPPASCISFAPFAGNEWRCTATFPQQAPNGAWPVSVYVRDVNLGQSVGVASEFQADGAPYIAAIVQSTSSDAGPPSINSFARSPASLDLNQPSPSITSTVGAIDAAGIRNVSTVWSSPNGELRSCTTSQGTDNTYQCTIPLNSIETGTWTLQEVTAKDTLGKQQQYTKFQIANLGAPNTFEVIDTSTVCGNALVEPPDEECEAGVALGDTCLTLGYVGGTLACDEPNCLYDVSGCVSPGCGNAIVEPGEDCEAGVAITDTCQDLGFAGGTLACDEPNCTYDTTGCTSDACTSFTTPWDLNVTGSWANSAAQTQVTQDLTYTVYARPGGHSIVSISDAPSAGFSDNAVLVRFNPSGLVDARDGANYGCGTGDGDSGNATCTFGYTAGTWYKFTVIVDVVAERYTVAVGECDEAQTTIIANAFFRTDALPVDAGGLDHFNVWGDTGVSIELKNATWVDSCTPFTCATYDPYSCGTPSDGCGSTIDCDTPAGGNCVSRNSGGWTGQAGDVCYQDSCCRPNAAAWCTSQNYECGNWNDGCGGSLNCDTGGQTCDERVAGEICIDGTCEDPGSALEPENTQGDTWEHIYEACTGDDYPVGYRPPLFVRPTQQNTGANCPDTASGCPSATLTDLGTNTISSPGTYENFYVEGGLHIDNVDGVTLRNFEIRCTPGTQIGLRIDNNLPNNTSNVVVEYGTIKKGTGYCIRALKGSHFDGLEVRHVWMDQYQEDGIQLDAAVGDVLVERSLFTRLGANGVSGGHVDVFQYFFPNAGDELCMLGSRAVPVYTQPTTPGAGCYKNSNSTQNGPNAPDKWYVYNNWIDGAVNTLIPKGELRNNKLGYFFQFSAWSGTDLGGNVWECNGVEITESTKGGAPGCLWGWPSWKGKAIDGWPPTSPSCYANWDLAPIDPTECCTSYGDCPVGTCP